MNSLWSMQAGALVLFVSWLLLHSFDARSVMAQTGTKSKTVCKEMLDSWYKNETEALDERVSQLSKLADKSSDSESYLAHYYAGLGHRQHALYSANRTASLKKSIAHLEKSIELNKDFIDAHALLGNVYRMLIATGNHEPQWFEKARNHREKAWSTAPGNPRVLLLEASALVFIPAERGGDIDEGIAFAFEAIGRFSIEDKSNSINWGEAETWALLGAAYKRKDNQEQSKACYERALKVQPNWMQLKKNLGDRQKPADKKSV